MANFVTSITLQFKDAFSSGFANAKNSMAGMKDALGEINRNKDMFDLAGDLSLMSGRFDELAGKMSAMMDVPSELAGSFESTMKNIQAITGMSSGEIEKLGGELNRIGGSTAAGPLAVAAAYNDVAGGITNVEAQMPVMMNAISLAEAGQADLGTATNGLVKIMNSYGFSVSKAATEEERKADISQKAAWASDVMTQAVGMGVGSMEEFISAMSPISGLASSVGVGFDEIGSTMAYMTATTDTAATAGTKLQSFMIALQKPSKELSSALAAVGITSGSAMLEEYGLAESARIVQSAFAGNQDAMVAAMGRAEAMQAVIALTGDSYSDFAKEFGSSMKGITEVSQAIQVESYESKMGRLQAASDALKIQMGDDINAIKGFFVDMQTGFLNNVVSPLMSSPVGGVFQRIAAFAGIAAGGVLKLGSGVLNTATQLVTLTTTISNAGGITKLFSSTLGTLKNAVTGIGSSLMSLIAPLWAKTTATFTATAAEAGFAAALWATAGALWAVLWPVLAVVAAGALIVKIISEVASGWGSVTAAFQNGGILAALLQIGKLMLSALIAPIQGFLELLSKIPGVDSLLQPAVDKLQEFRNSLKGTSAEEIGAEAAVTVKSETSSEFTGIDTGELSANIQGLQKQIGKQPIGTAGTTGIGTNDDGGAALIAEHMAAASRKGFAVSSLTSDVSDAFMNGGKSEYAVSDMVAKNIPVPDFERATETMQLQFSEVLPQKEAVTIKAFNETDKKEQERPNQSFKIENIYLQADDCKTLFDLMRQIEFAVQQREAV
ncbi:phage tail tape measure protein [Treponema phagedenis]|uniref:Phage tail tape measure protein n=1 Tax=Treponema phagedenis TaxID=162 RepID=A0AAE6IWI4_TREPH|nr:phage tail tape measure protein [Treponema phagedenis]NVP23974.1 phage tail tape measure protein [Treponema phagedenis]QEJ99457.1 phage tail tape measure protein [Treponema phagedenis]QEK05028.1 phage tail tape measure protein [Treponema phagedenis]QEK10649.1 phage tail tape measure protein [Treponema phagedenis]QLC59508.1 phage tail tape measure protein [Treponema phagedenis]